MADYCWVYDCRLTAKNQDQLRNPNRVWATFFTRSVDKGLLNRWLLLSLWTYICLFYPVADKAIYDQSTDDHEELSTVRSVGRNVDPSSLCSHIRSASCEFIVIYSIISWYYSRTGCVGMGMCCVKKMMTVWRTAWSMKLSVQDQEEDQRKPGERLSKRTVKHVNWTQRMLRIVANGGSW